MKTKFFISLIACLLMGSFSSAFAFLTYPPPVDPNTGQPETGVTTPGPNGTTITTYSDGWVKTTEPDNGFGNGGKKETLKDARGRIREIHRFDPNGRLRHHTLIMDNPDGSRSLFFENYSADGELIDASREDEKDGTRKKYVWNPRTQAYEEVASRSDPKASKE